MNYVTMRSGVKFAVVDGPYPTREEAIAAVPAAVAWVEARDTWACFYQFCGTEIKGDLPALPLMRRGQ